MHFLVFFACFMTVFAQYEYVSIGTLVETDKFNGSIPEIDYCQNDTHGCQSVCVNGTYPPYGYTCKVGNSSLLEVDAGSQQLFELAKTISSEGEIKLSQKIVYIENITVDLVDGKVIYSFGLSGALSDTEVNYFFPVIPSVISSKLQSTDYSVNVDRISVTASNSNTVLVVTFLLPKTATVTWTSLQVGSILMLKSVVYDIVNLNISDPRDQLLEDNGYFENNNTVWVTFIEDLSKAQGTDSNLMPRACNFSKALFLPTNQDMVVSQSYYNVTPSTIKSTENCPLLSQPQPRKNEVGERVVRWFWIGALVLFILKDVW